MPPRRTTPKGYELARALRHELTPAERKLWARLRNDQLGANFRRQHAIGKYIPDFCCVKAKIIIELDGAQHAEQEQYDAERTQYLESQGYKVIRFWNHQVMNEIESVILVIMDAINPHPASPKFDNQNSGNNRNSPVEFGGGAEGGGGV